MSAAVFEAERPRLCRIAVRILGGSEGAEDIVQEAWLRFARTDGVEDPPAWLTTTVTRLCLDHLRKRRSRSDAEAGAQAGHDLTVDPEADALLADQISGALQVVLDTLMPAERAAFVLHDAFGYRFDEIGAALGRSETAARKLASRARLKMRGADQPAAERAVRAENRQVVDAFLEAAHGGQLMRLLDLLAPDAVMRPDLVAQGMGAEPVYDGAPAVAGRFNGGARGARGVSIDGEPGLAWFVGSEAKVVFAFHIVGGRVKEIEQIADPDVLATISVVPV